MYVLMNYYLSIIYLIDWFSTFFAVIEGKVTNYEKIQNATIGKDYFKFVPEWRDATQTDITFEVFINSIR